MIRRCTNPNDPHYPRWGGRGITVCDRWREFPNFLADMGERPQGMTLERKDNERGYEPGNCEWASWVAQARNKRSATLTPDKIRKIAYLYSGSASIGSIAAETAIDRHVVGVVCATLDVMVFGT